MNNKALIERLLDAVNWQPIEGASPEPQANNDNLPYATHKGILKMGGVEFRVYQLNDGQRVILKDDVDRLFRGGEGESI